MGHRKLSDLMCRKNPWKGGPCSKKKCWPCQGDPERSGNCQVENITYTITCVRCRDGGVSTTYTGESSQNMHLHRNEHHQTLLKEDEDSTLWNHCKETHSGEIQVFHMNLLRKHKLAFTRQVSEGIEIERCKSDLILNRKGEWNGSCLPRMAVEVKEKVELKELGDKEPGKRKATVKGGGEGGTRDQNPKKKTKAGQG